jgi:hypothetical protein
MGYLNGKEESDLCILLFGFFDGVFFDGASTEEASTADMC